MFILTDFLLSRFTNVSLPDDPDDPGVPAVAHIREALGRNDPYRVSYRRMY